MKTNEATYKPDNWVILKFKSKDDTWYKILSSWHGGYLTGSSWRLSSGLIRIESTLTHHIMYNYSGSEYIVYKDAMGLHGMANNIYLQIKKEGKLSKVQVKQITVDQFNKEMALKQSEPEIRKETFKKYPHLGKLEREAIIKSRMKIYSNMKKEATLKVGDKVRLKKSLIEWYLSNEGQNSFFPPSGVLSPTDSLMQDTRNTLMLLLAMDKSIKGEVIKHNHPNSIDENFRIKILNVELNILAKDLIKVK